MNQAETPREGVNGATSPRREESGQDGGGPKGSPPFVTVVIPCRNEEAFVGICLNSIVANDYPPDRLEILVVDGMSQDGTREMIKAHAEKYPCIKMLDNPRKVTPVALNLGIKSSRGEIVLRVDAHSSVEKDHIRHSVEGLLNHPEAVIIGGNMKTIPRQNTVFAHAVVNALTHRFGVGNSHFRVNSREPRWVDTVFGGCSSRDLFEKYGLFNEDLARGQDMEFSLRVSKRGGRILLLPEIVSYYYSRSGIRSYCHHNWDNGVWAILPFAYSEFRPVSWRHLVPLAFVSGLLGSALLGWLVKPFLWLFVGLVVIYTLATLVVSFQIAWRERDGRYVFAMPLTFWMLHFPYGLGSLWGAIKLAGVPSFWRKLFGRTSKT